MTSAPRKRVLVLVLAMDKHPWREIEDEGQRTTWAGSDQRELPVFWLYGRSGRAARTFARLAQRAIQRLAPERVFDFYSSVVGRSAAARPVKEDGDRLETGVPETYLNTNPKTIAGLRHILQEHEFDYVLRTNTSSYVNLKKLQEYVQELPEASFYGGYIGESGSIKFASGTCTLISRDLVELAVNDPAWEYGIVDDVALGRSMHRAGIDVRPLSRVDILSREDLDALEADALRSAFVVRCKSNDDRSHDVIAMKRVHELYGVLEEEGRTQ